MNEPTRATDPQLGISIRFIRQWRPEPFGQSIARDVALMALLEALRRRAEIVELERLWRLDISQ